MRSWGRSTATRLLPSRQPNCASSTIRTFLSYWISDTEPAMDEAQEIKRQQRGEESRIALLDAGVELLNEQSLDVILSARAVARRAERSTGSFFHYWKT